MRYLCPEMENAPIEQLINEYFVSRSSYSSELSDSEAKYYPYFKVKTNEENVLYGKEGLKHYLAFRDYDDSARTITGLASGIGVDIVHNFGTFTKEFYFWFQDFLRDFQTNIWFTIFSDERIYFYKPERLTTSKSIENFTIASELVGYEAAIDLSYEGESGVKYTVGTDAGAVIPKSVDVELKRMIVNKAKSKKSIVTIQTQNIAFPLDYFMVNSKVYLVVSKKDLHNGMYEYIGVLEVSETPVVNGTDDTPLTALNAAMLDGQHGSYYGFRSIGSVYKNGSQVINITPTDYTFRKITSWAVDSAINHNNGMVWDATNHAWKCTIAGIYHFEFSLYIHAMNSTWDIWIQHYDASSGSTINSRYFTNGSVYQAKDNPRGHFTLALEVNDLVYINYRAPFSNSTIWGANNAHSRFECWRVY